MTRPTVSVVLVNFRGASDTLECLRVLGELDYPADRLELIVVDNDPYHPEGIARLRAEAPAGVQLVESPVNGGFTGGCNLGAETATGEYLAFINNDARPDRAWLAEAIAVLQRDGTVGCVASKVLDWEGKDVDFVAASLTWYGMGYKPGAGMPYDGDHEDAADVLFATGSAMITRTALFRAVGGFDERFFMFYEDVDYGWRLNVLGHRVRYVPGSVVYHRHHASMGSYGEYREWYLLERNALMCLYKNAGDELLCRVLAPAIALAVRRSLAVADVDTAQLDLRRASVGGDAADQDTLVVPRRGLSGAFAVDGFLDQLPSLAATRAELQAQRVRSDRELVPLFGNPIEPAIPVERYLDGHRALVDAFRIADAFDSPPRVLVVTADRLGAAMAGPGIRAFHLADQLSATCRVTLATTAPCSLRHPRVTCVGDAAGELRGLVAEADVVVVQGFVLHRFPFLSEADAVLVVDLYDPMHLEQLEQTRTVEHRQREQWVSSTTSVLNEQLECGDFFICASEEQRNFWLGQLAGVGRLNPANYERDPSLESLIAVCPFGMPDEEPEHVEAVLRGVVPGIGADDKVIIWGGGVYDWFDPLTLVRAVGRLARTRPDVRLFFLGMTNPSPDVPLMDIGRRTRALAAELGLTDRNVFFNDGWIDYDRRQNYLLEADIGVSTHSLHVETTFAFRTRMLDYLWAGLPMVSTVGDHFARLIEAEGLGITVAEGDDVALAAALETVLYDDTVAKACRANIERVRPRFRWSAATRPLAEFCAAPRRAADAPARSEVGRALRLRLGARQQVVANVRYARARWAEGGATLVARRGYRKLRTLAGGRQG